MTFRARRGPQYVKVGSIYVPEAIISADRLAAASTGQVVAKKADGTLEFATPSGGSGGGSSLTPPLVGDFATQVNIGSETTLDDTSDGLVMAIGTGGTGTVLRCIFKTMPSTPYTITFKARFMSEGTAGDGAGLMLRDSTGGKVIKFELQYTGPQFIVEKWNSVTSFSAAYKATTSIIYEPYFQLVDDGTNFVFNIGVTAEGPWLPFYSVSRTDWLAAPDQVGFGVEDQNLNNYFVLVQHYVES